MFLSIKSIWWRPLFWSFLCCQMLHIIAYSFPTSLEGGTTIGCLHGRSAPRAPFVRMWFFILRISPQRKRSWDGSWSEGRDLSRPWGTSGKRRGWVHTLYLSRKPREFSCKFFLAGVNFYRFNAKNWHFRHILREKLAFFTDLTRKIGVFRCKFYSPKILLV